MIQAKDLKTWINRLTDEQLVAIAMNGETLVAFQPDAGIDKRIEADLQPERAEAWLDVKGVPLEDYIGTTVAVEPECFLR